MSIPFLVKSWFAIFLVQKYEDLACVFRLFTYYLCILHRYLVEWKNILQLLFLVKDNPPQYILALRSFLVLIRGPETLTDDERLSKLRIFMICWCQVTYLSCSLDGHTRSFCKRGKRGVHIEYTDDYSPKIEKKRLVIFDITFHFHWERTAHLSGKIESLAVLQKR